MLKQEQVILPERFTVRDPQGSQYVVEGVLGRGGFGAVYLVRERSERRGLFALKEVINPDKDDRLRFAFEGEILKRLQHKALPRVHHVFEIDRLKRVYLLMDYINGQNLEVLRGEQPGKCFPLPLVLVLMAPIVDALTYLHSQNPPIIHRDIKPANIIIPSGGGEAMLADFGSAKEYVPGSATTMVGRRSPGYAALEQYRSGTNPSTDIYSLGATLYALLTGSAPIDAPSRVVESLSTGVDPLKPANLLVPSVPPDVARALQRAMSIRMADRYETVEEFWQVLMDHDMRRRSRSISLDLSQPSPPEQDIEEAETGPLLKAQIALRSKKRGAFRIIACLLVLLALAIAAFSYLGDFPVLLLISPGVLFLALAVLLCGLPARTRPL